MQLPPGICILNPQIPATSAALNPITVSYPKGNWRLVFGSNFLWASLVAQTAKNLPAMWDLGLIPGLGRSLGEGMTTQYSILLGESQWTVDPSGLQSMGSQRVRHDWVNQHSFILLSYAMLWRKLPAEGQHKYGVHFIYFPYLKDLCSVCPMPKNSYFISIGQNICIISFCTCYIQEDKSNTYHFLMARIQVFFYSVLNVISRLISLGNKWLKVICLYWLNAWTSEIAFLGLNSGVIISELWYFGKLPRLSVPQFPHL